MRVLLAAALLILAGCGHVVPGSLTGDGQPFVPASDRRPATSISPSSVPQSSLLFEPR